MRLTDGLSALRAQGSQGPRWPFRVNRNSPLARGLVFFLPFESGAGFGYDLANNRHGTVVGAPLWRGGRQNRIVGDFPAAGDYLNFANGGPWTLPAAIDFTIHLRFALTAATTDFDTLCGDYNQATGANGWVVLADNGATDNLDFRMGGTAGFSNAAMGAQPATGVWLDLTIRVTDNVGIDYLRDLGAITTAALAKTRAVAASPFRVNQRADTTGRDAPARYERMALWNRKLSDGEMYALHRPETRWDLYAEDSASQILIEAADPAGVVASFYQPVYRRRRRA